MFIDAVAVVSELAKPITAQVQMPLSYIEIARQSKL